MTATINVCETCGYWPINGEEYRPSCRRCGTRRPAVPVEAVVTLRELYGRVCELHAGTLPLRKAEIS